MEGECYHQKNQTSRTENCHPRGGAARALVHGLECPIFITEKKFYHVHTLLKLIYPSFKKKKKFSECGESS